MYIHSKSKTNSRFGTAGRGLRRLTAILMLFVLMLTGAMTVFGSTASDSGESTSQDVQINALSDIKDMNLVIGIESSNVAGAELDKLCDNYTVQYYDNPRLGIEAVASGKIDDYVCGENYFDDVLGSGSVTGVKVLEDPVITYELALLLYEDAPIENYKSRVNECIAQLLEDGTMDDMKQRWFTDGNFDMPELDLPENPEYNLKIVTYGQLKPYSFIKDNELAGFDVELAYRVAAYLGCGIDISYTEYTGIFMGVSTGKYDLASANLYVTDDRRENASFSDTFDYMHIKMLVRDNSVSESETSFIDTLKSGFRRTFIDEDRWQMILSGLAITMVITVLGFMLANVFGAIFCACALSKHAVLRGVEDVYTRIMQGTPIVVILMILFYIIFSDSSISGVWVAVLGFGLTSGSSLARQFKGAITSVPKEQTEAGLALGFSNTQTFTGIVCPQAVRRLLPGYFSEIIALLKGTAITGYVAVTDLTKVSDVIRSSTYDAFFPLFSVALIYFLISFLLLSLLKYIQKKLLPKRVMTQQEAADDEGKGSGEAKAGCRTGICKKSKEVNK